MSQTSQTKIEGLDGLIVLGPGRLPFGYSSRAKTAAFYDANSEIPIIVTGGRGHFCKNMQETEATKLKKQLQKLGIDGRAIRVEPEPSSSTYQNFEYSKGLIWLLQIKKLGVVTNSPHMPRALQQGYQAFDEGKITLRDCELYPVPIRHDFKGCISELGCLVYEQIIRPGLHVFSELKQSLKHIKSYKPEYTATH